MSMGEIQVGNRIILYHKVVDGCNCACLTNHGSVLICDINRIYHFPDGLNFCLVCAREAALPMKDILHSAQLSIVSFL